MNLLAEFPDIPTAEFANILPSLERHHITVSDVLTLDSVDVARRAQVPVREVRRLTDVLLKALRSQYGHLSPSGQSEAYRSATTTIDTLLVLPGPALPSMWSTISTLDGALDQVLAGGVRTGYLTEITGESGAGKTQLLLTLLLSVQLPRPSGLSRSAIYVSTETPLSTARLSQLIKSNPFLSGLPPTETPSLSRILSIKTSDLEAQEHILRYQVPVAIKRHNVGLLVIDSITANYRAEFEGQDQPLGGGRAGASMARRSSQLMQIGGFLRDLARTENVAVVVANQVADRFSREDHDEPRQHDLTSSSHPAPSCVQSTQLMGKPPPSTDPQKNLVGHVTRDPLTLNHQQNFFTGWGDESLATTPHLLSSNQKTPSLGLIWTNQIASRIALVRTPSREEQGKWQRHLKVVFSPWAAATSGRGVAFEVVTGGLRAVGVTFKDKGGKGNADAAV